MNYNFAPYIRISETNDEILVDSIASRKTVRIFDETLKNEFHRLLESKGCDTISSPLEKCLNDEKLLVSRREMIRFLNETQLLMDKKLLVTIMPTEACNFRCPYCYENHDSITMSDEIAYEIKKYIADVAGNFEVVSVGWFGGEPTLCMDRVLDISRFIKELEKSASFKLSISMTTNGYLLTKERFLQFYQVGINSYQITLDGWGHDRTRPLLSGEETLKTILNNLKEISGLSKEQYRFDITIRHNILKDDMDFSWYDYLYRLFGNDERFSVLVRSVGDWGGKTVNELNLLQGTESEQLVSKHIQYLEKIGMKYRKGTHGIFSRICYASYKHSMVFRANGKIEKCTVALDHPKNYIGHVDPLKGVVIDETTNYQWYHTNLQEKCFSCKEIFTCFNMRCPKKCLIDGITQTNCSEQSLKIY